VLETFFLPTGLGLQRSKKRRLPFVVRFIQREIGARAFFLSHHLFKRVDRDEILVEIKEETPTARYEELSRRADISQPLITFVEERFRVRVSAIEFLRKNRALKSSEI
jgi:hypothetical protein